MKHLLYLTLLLSFPLFSAERAAAAVPEPSQQAEWTECRENMLQLAAILTANRVADVSLQQNNPFGNHQTVRRYPVSAPSFLQGVTRWSPLPAAPELCRFSLQERSRCLTRQKETGYYIYGLRKIII